MPIRGAALITAFILLSGTTTASRVGAFDRFVGMSDKGSTQVKNCVDGVSGKESFANSTELNVALVIDLDGGDGLEGDDSFDAVFSYDGLAAPATVFNDVIVPATDGWVDSGIAIEAGNTLAVSATGSASPNGIDNFNGPDGAVGDCVGCLAELPDSRYALVGRIGNGPPFEIGSSYIQTAFESGSLFLGFNDSDSGDNGGSFSVSGEISPAPRLMRGIWSKIDERSGVETYQLTPSGDLTNLSISGWWYLVSAFAFISEEAGNACQDPPFSHVSVAVSDIAKGILVVKKPIDVGSRKCDAACQDACGGANCREAEVSLDVRAIMNNESANSAFSAKRDLVRFKYKAKGFVALNP